jgi:hypothetical protein
MDRMAFKFTCGYGLFQGTEGFREAKGEGGQIPFAVSSPFPLWPIFSESFGVEKNRSTLLFVEPIPVMTLEKKIRAERSY